MRNQRGSLKQMKFGVDIWKPTWWPEERWAWADTKHFRQNPNFPGPGKLGDFLTYCIELILQEANLNAADHVTQNPDPRKLAAKKRWRGIRAVPAVAGDNGNETLSPINSPQGPSAPPSPVVRSPTVSRSPSPPLIRTPSPPASRTPSPPASRTPSPPLTRSPSPVENDSEDTASNQDFETPSPNSSQESPVNSRRLPTIREDSPLSIPGPSGLQGSTRTRGLSTPVRNRQQPVRREAQVSDGSDIDESSVASNRPRPSVAASESSSRQPRRRRNSSINKDRPRIDPVSPVLTRMTRSRSRQSGNS